MDHYDLRKFMMFQKLCTPHYYANKELVIDGNIFKDLYKTSGCQYILGGEYDRFASSLKNFLNILIKSDIKCFVVFNGAGQSGMERRKHVHQKIIDRTYDIKPGNFPPFCEPIFVKEVYRDVLDELGIKNYTCMDDSTAALLSLAKQLGCPILSNKIEYALYGVSVIQFKSVKFNEGKRSIECLLYSDSLCREWYRQWSQLSKDLISILLAVTNKNSNVFYEVLDMLSCSPQKYIPTIILWISYQNAESAIKCIKNHLKEEERQHFMDATKNIKKLFEISRHSPAVDYFIKTRPIGREQIQENLSDTKWFEYNISVGRVAPSFINLKNKGILSGSWVVYNKNREDAMLVAIDIALYARALLTNSPEAQITFIGRKDKTCYVDDLKKIVNIQTQQKGTIDHFNQFLMEHLPGLDLKTFEPLAEDSWVILIALLYYNKKAKVNITNVVYSVILSYVLLGPVSEKVGVIKKSYFSETHEVLDKDGAEETGNNAKTTSLTYEHCLKASNAVVDLFDAQQSALMINFDYDALHTLSEFQYCLQFINYLNMLCGGNIKCTKYHKALNCTFVYNVFIALKDESDPGNYVQNLLNCPPVYLYFNNILDVYFRCLNMLKD